MKCVCHAAQSIYIQQDNRYVRIILTDITHIKALKNYIRIVTPGMLYTTQVSMKQMEEQLPGEQFCRVHKSYMVAIKNITSFDEGKVYLDKIEIPLSENYRPQLEKKIKIITTNPSL